MDQENGIGYQDRLPWHLSSDLKRFKSLTMGHHLIMGRKTYQSIGKLLPGRVMIVVSKDLLYRADGCIIVNTIDDGLQFARENGEEEVFIIGGGQIFIQTLPKADRIYLTLVHATTAADVFFPSINQAEWKEIQSIFQPARQGDDFDHSFIVLHRQAPAN
jgi:dihydrofolate reductase